MHRSLKFVSTIRVGAGIALAILTIPLQVSGQNGQAPPSPSGQTQSSASKTGTKTPQQGTDIPCVPSAANTTPVTYKTPAPPGQKHHVDLHWSASASPEVHEYRVYRCTPVGPCSVITSVVSGTSYTDDTVQPRQDYCYFVTAFVKGRPDSAPSNFLYVTIPSP